MAILILWGIIAVLVILVFYRLFGVVDERQSLKNHMDYADRVRRDRELRDLK